MAKTFDIFKLMNLTFQWISIMFKTNRKYFFKKRRNFSLLHFSVMFNDFMFSIQRFHEFNFRYCLGVSSCWDNFICSIFISICWPSSVYVVSMWSIFHFHPQFQCYNLIKTNTLAFCTFSEYLILVFE